MKAKATALMLADLGVTKSHSRPHTSNDNPFSEAHFKTLKYQPEFPERFGCVEDAKDFCRRFFEWYNQHHHHAGLGLMTPNQVHTAKPTTSMPPDSGPLITLSAPTPGQSGEARIFLIQDDNLTAEVPLRRSILQSTLRQKYRSTGRHNPQRDGGPEKGLYRLHPIALAPTPWWPAARRSRTRRRRDAAPWQWPGDRRRRRP